MKSIVDYIIENTFNPETENNSIIIVRNKIYSTPIYKDIEKKFKDIASKYDVTFKDKNPSFCKGKSLTLCDMSNDTFIEIMKELKNDEIISRVYSYVASWYLDNSCGTECIKNYNLD